MAETTEIFILRLFIYGVVGAIVVALSTLAVEKLGGTWGGFVSMIPSLVIVTTIGLYLTTGNRETHQQIMFAVPIGGWLTTCIFYVIRFLPSRLPNWESKAKQVITVFGIALFVWVSGAAAVVFGVKRLYNYVPVQWIGLFFLVLNVCMGICVACFNLLPAQKSTMKIYFMRGLGGFCAVVISVGLSKVDKVVAALLSVFPTIGITVLIALWISNKKGKEVVLGTMGSMTLTGSATSVFCYSLAWFEEIQQLPFGVCVLLGFLTSMILDVIPVAVGLTFRKKWSQRQQEVELPELTDIERKRLGLRPSDTQLSITLYYLN